MNATDVIVDVLVDDWVESCNERAERGLDVVDWLTAVDTADRLYLLVHLVDPGSGNAEMLRCELDVEAPRAPSVVARFPGADWHERETSEMFGIEFTDRGDLEPLLWRQARTPALSAPLRKASALTARVDTPWPGRDQNERSRRRKLPPGVRAEWVDDE